MKSFPIGLFIMSVLQVTLALANQPARVFIVEQDENTKQTILGSDYLLNDLKGLLFLHRQYAVNPMPVDTRGVEVRRIPWLDNDNFKTVIKEKFLGKPLHMRDLDTIVQTVVLYAKEQGRPVVDAYVPVQNVSNHAVQIVVITGEIDEIRVEGNKGFSENSYLKELYVQQGDEIDSEQLTEDLIWLNRDPFRSVKVAFERGRKTGKTNLVLVVEDEAPYRFFGGFENTGNDLTEMGRVFTGAQWGNAWGLRHRLSYQFTANPDFSRVQSHSASYIVPLPWRHDLVLFGGYGWSDAELASGFNIAGRSYQGGMRYQIPLKDIDTYTHTFSLGADYKRTNNNIDFSGTTITDAYAEVIQGVAQYEARRPDAWGITDLDLQAVWSPGNLSGRNNDQSLQTIRAHTQAQYAFTRMHAERNTYLPLGLRQRTAFSFQWASDNLMPSEQIGVGGMNSVRGFEERETSGDRGYVLQAELYTPTVTASNVFKDTDYWGDLQGLVFYDMGRAVKQKPTNTEKHARVFSSAGVGARFRYQNYLTLNADVGVQLKEKEFNAERSQRAHIYMLWQF